MRTCVWTLSYQRAECSPSVVSLDVSATLFQVVILVRHLCSLYMRTALFLVRRCESVHRAVLGGRLVAPFPEVFRSLIRLQSTLEIHHDTCYKTIQPSGYREEIN